MLCAILAVAVLMSLLFSLLKTKMGKAEAISEFVSITGTDTDTARHYLDLGDWDVEQGLNLFFSSIESRNGDNSSSYEGARAPIPAREDQVLDSSEVQELNDAYDASHRETRSKRVKVHSSNSSSRGGGVTITESVKTVVVTKNKKGKSVDAFRNFKDDSDIRAGKKVSHKASVLNEMFRAPLKLLFNGTFEEVYIGAIHFIVHPFTLLFVVVYLFVLT